MEALTTATAKARTEHEAHVASLTSLSESRLRECREAAAESQTKLDELMARLSANEQAHATEVGGGEYQPKTTIRMEADVI